MANYSHLSYEERISIEDGLNNNKSIYQISKERGRSHSTLLREIARNKVFYNSRNWSINKKYVDPNYNFHCDKLDKPPHVCNGCKSRQGCRKERFTDYARQANDS